MLNNDIRIYVITLTLTWQRIAPKWSRLVPTETVPASDEPYTFIDVYKITLIEYVFKIFWYQSNKKILSIKKGSRELLTAMFGNSFLRFVDVIGGTLAPTGVTHWTLHKSFRFNPVDSKSTSDIWTKWWDPRIRLAGLTFFTWFSICFTSVFSPYICSLWIKDE